MTTLTDFSQKLTERERVELFAALQGAIERGFPPEDPDVGAARMAGLLTVLAKLEVAIYGAGEHWPRPAS